MKWVIFTGSWRLTNKEVETDVRRYAREVFERGWGLTTGGATGVDYYAMDEFVKINPDCTRIRIFIPARIEHFIADYKKNWMHSPIDEADIDNLGRLLRLIQKRNPTAIFEVKKESGDITQEEYNLRHNEEVTFSDEVYAFQVNDSRGTSDTIEKAKAAGLAITLHKTYSIPE